MGLFSRREKAPKPMVDSKPAHILSTSQSKSSLTSGSSSIKSPIGGFSSSRMMNRTSAGTTSTSGGTSTPNTSFSPTTPAMPRIDMPRPPDPQLDPAGYLRSLGAVRERSKVVTEKAYRNQLHHFDVDMAKFDDVVTFVSNIIKVSRWTKGGVQRPRPRALPWGDARERLTRARLARLRRPLYQHPRPRPPPAFWRRRPRSDRPPPLDFSRGCRQHRALQAHD